MCAAICGFLFGMYHRDDASQRSRVPRADAIQYNRAKSECGYNATPCQKMLQEHGGVQTDKFLLRALSVSDGFVELYTRKQLDLTDVSQILSHPEFWPLFEENELDTARRWLKGYR
jgi:hypothetical protein